MSDMSLLYEAATNSLASDASSNNCWTKMVERSVAYSSWKDFKDEAKATEDRIKSEYDLTSMPSPWRSAKSVVMSALKADIALFDENGQPKGKSFIQQELKDLKPTDVKDLFAECFKRLKFIKNNFIHLDKTQQATINIFLKDIHAD